MVRLDGTQAWNKFYVNCNRKTLGDNFRVQRECMYLKAVKDVEQVMYWEEMRKAIMRELYVGVKVPDLWRMSAQAETYPSNVKKQMLIRLDEIVNINVNFKTQVESHATKAEQNLGGQKETSAPMDVNNVSDGGRDEEG